MRALPVDLLRLAEHAPPSVVLAGASMEPGLRPGDRLRIVPCGLPAPGDVVALRSGAPEPSPVFVVHRVVWTAELDGRGAVFHKGDASGRIGLARSEHVVGRVAAVLSPVERDVPALVDLDRDQRRAFLRARRRCRLYVALRRLRIPAMPARVHALARRLVPGA